MSVPASSSAPTPPANLADLARLAGVSTATVSRALAGSTLISSKTRDRIADLAAAHGFQVNQAARNLRLKRTHAISVVLPLGVESAQHVSDPFVITMLGFLADALTERGYDLLLTRIVPTDDRWLDRLVDSGRVDGAIIIGQSDQSAALERTGARYRPMVVWGERASGQPYAAVGSDNVEGGRLAAEHLLAGGRRRLAFLGNPVAPEVGARYRGYVAAHAAHGVSVDPALLAPVQLSSERSFGEIRAFLAAHPDIDGIVAASDVVAMNALRALAELGRSVPHDVALVGYDDVPFAAHTAPPLTTIRQDLAEGAAALVEALFARLAGEAHPGRAIMPRLVIRSSAP